MQDEEEEEKEEDGEARQQEISQQFNKLLLEPIRRWEPIRKEEPITNQEQIRMQEPVVFQSFLLPLSYWWRHLIQLMDESFKDPMKRAQAKQATD